MKKERADNPSPLSSKILRGVAHLFSALIPCYHLNFPFYPSHGLDNNFNNSHNPVIISNSRAVSLLQVPYNPPTNEYSYPNLPLPSFKQLPFFPTLSGYMSPAISKCNKLRRIVRIRQMLQRWHKKARLTAARAPSDVPSGHVAVCVGSNCKRFIVRATYLNHPIFQKLLEEAEEEYGFANQGPLAIPCDESFFEEVLRVLARSESGNSGRFLSVEDLQRRCHGDALNQLEYLGESRPLLRARVG